MRTFTDLEHRLLGVWALVCARHVLPLFEKVAPGDFRPRIAVEACRTWCRTGRFEMKAIRRASLDAHAAARRVKTTEAAMFAARAAGQAVATAHVTQHAYGAAYYALKAVAAAAPAKAASRVARERAWQNRRLPQQLRREIASRIVVEEKRGKLVVTIRKGPGF